MPVRQITCRGAQHGSTGQTSARCSSNTAHKRQMIEIGSTEAGRYQAPAAAAVSKPQRTKIPQHTLVCGLQQVFIAGSVGKDKKQPPHLLAGVQVCCTVSHVGHKHLPAHHHSQSGCGAADLEATLADLVGLKEACKHGLRDSTAQQSKDNTVTIVSNIRTVKTPPQMRHHRAHD